MSEYDLHSNISVHVALELVNITSNINSKIRDTIGFESIEILVQSQSLSFGTFSIVLEEDDLANFSTSTPVSVDDTLGDLPVFENTDGDTVKRVGSIGKKRYQRFTIQPSGQSGTNNFSGIFILGNPHTAPVA